MIRQLLGGVLQRLQSRFDVLFIVGMLADVLADDDLKVGVDADLPVAGVVEHALLAHDPRLGIGKTDLLTTVDDLIWVKRGFAGFQRLFGGFDFGQSRLLELQIFREFVAGFLPVSLVFLLIAATGLFN